MSQLSTKRMSRVDADAILAELAIHFPELEIIPAGSYRRGKESFGDLDLCIVVSDLWQIRPQLEGIFTIHSGGARRILSIHKNSGFQVDFYSTSPELKEAMLLTLTGSAHLNVLMRSTAKKLGMKLNQYGLWKESSLISSNEHEIFEKLGMIYLDPKDRDIKFSFWD